LFSNIWSVGDRFPGFFGKLVRVSGLHRLLTQLTNEAV
jgi:hypothetical protein